VLIAFWSAKGGSGTTVVATAMALVLARRSPVMIADLAGDVPAVLGLPGADGPGLMDWIAAPDVGAEGLARLETEAAPGVRLLPRGHTEPDPAPGGNDLPAALAARAGVVVADCGLLGQHDTPASRVARRATLSLLVIRPCFLALRRAAAIGVRPSAAVVVAEPKRCLHARDVTAVLHVPVVAVVPFEPAVARAVDTGALARRVPVALAAPLGRVLR